MFIFFVKINASPRFRKKALSSPKKGNMFQPFKFQPLYSEARRQN